MYRWWNPIHIIKGKKTVVNEELIKKFIKPEEQKKRTIYTISMYLIPFLYIYLCLILTNNIEILETVSRIFIYVPAFLFFIYIKYLRIKYEINLINICSKREKQNIKNKSICN